MNKIPIAIWQSAASAFLLIAGFCLITLVGSPVAFADATLPVQNPCPDGQERDAGLCYPKCRSGYSGTATRCYEVCPTGYTDTGLFCTKTYTKTTKPRGIGTIPTVCPIGQENDGGLCYTKCNLGDKGIGPICYKPCPAGTTDIGLICSKTEAKSSYTRGAGTIPTSCGPGKENQAGLCYTSCNADYYGVGPVCWQSCPAGYRDDGASCYKNILTWFFKKSYGRGAGTVPNQCAVGKELQSGLCYTNCSAGYKGVGPVCWQICPTGTRDTGAFCESSTAKATYGRGVGTKPSLCSAGKELQAGLCYDRCPTGYSGVANVCWENCPTGYNDKGAFCDMPPITKASYDRGAGKIPPCVTGRKYDTKYTSVLTNYLTAKKFTMIVASDPQFPWWRGGDDSSCSTDECVLEKAKSTNNDHVRAMNVITTVLGNANGVITKGIWPNVTGLTSGAGTTVTKPLGVIMNGDLTAYWHSWQKELYREYYELGFKLNTGHSVLALPIFPGLGNHDYANNLKEFDSTQSCYGNTLDPNFCAKDAVRYIKNMVYCDSVRNFVNTLVQKFDEDSIAYAFDIGDYHFVQLNNYPTYVANSIKIKSAITWLKTDLTAATAAGKKTVLNFHDYGEHMLQNNAEFLAAIKNQKVVALFTGHTHQAGYVGTIPGTTIPIFRAGSAEYSKFLLAEFGEDYINVGEVSSTNGVPKFFANKVKTYRIP